MIKINFFKQAKSKISLFVILLCLLLSNNINAQAVGCTNTMYLSQGTFSPSTEVGFYRINNSTNPFTYPLMKQHAGLIINAIGINPVDGNMYGMRYSNANLVRIDTNGNFINLGTIPGLPILDYNTGEIDVAGNYYVKATGLNNKFYKINLSTNAVTSLTLSATLELSDWAFNNTDGQLYSVNLPDGRLYKINPSTGNATPIGAAYSMPDAFGAMFGASNGEIYGAINSGGFYQFNTVTGARTLISASPAADQNDGAHCVTQPITFNVNLYVSKTDSKTTYTSGSTTTYTIVAGNTGPFGVVNANVTDPVPAGIPSANVTYTAVASAGSSTQVVGTQTGAINDFVSLPVGGTVTYTVTVNIPTTFTADLVNTVTITAPINSVETNSANNSATDTNTRVCVTPPTPTVSAGGPTTFCAGGSVTLTSSSASGNQWYKDGVIISGATGQTYSANASGIYTVIVTTIGCPSPASAGTTVTVNPIPPALTVSAGGPTTFCTGGSVVLTSTYNTTGAYQWYLNGTLISGATSYQYTASAPGTYTVTRELGGCTSPASAGTTVTVNPTPPALTVSAGGPTTFCTGGSVVLTSTYNTTGAYQWYLNGTLISGATSYQYTASASGTYTVTRELGGCPSPASAGTTVTVNPTPPALAVSAGGPTTFCTGGSVVLTSTYNTTGAYQWYLNGTVIPGAVSYQYTATGSGTYTVTRELGGCTSSASAGTTVTVNNCTGIACNTKFYLTQYPVSGPTTLYELDNTTNPFTITSIGTSPANMHVNAIGYNTVDNLIYGIRTDAGFMNYMVRIDGNGVFTSLGAVTNLPTGGYNSGAFDNSGNYYVLNSGSTRFYRINVTTNTATLITLSRLLNVNDIVYDKTTGKMFGYEGVSGANILVSIDPVTGTVTNIGASGLPDGTLVGALYVDASGDIFGNADNGSGFYQFNKTTGTAVKISNSIGANGNDGTNCPDAVITFPADLSITKTDGKTVYTPGTTNTYTIVVSNNSGQYGVLGATVSDPVPAGIPAANVSYSVPVLTGGATTSITGTQTGALNDVVGLPIGATITYTVTINVPVAFTGDLTNTVTVTPPVNSTDPNNANNSATDVDSFNNPCAITASNPDSDGDGIANSCDVDDDNDGILDTNECGSNNRIIRGDFSSLPTPSGNLNAAQVATATSNKWIYNGSNGVNLYWGSVAGGFGNGIVLEKDNQTESLTQSLSDVNYSYSGTPPQILITRFAARNGIGGTGSGTQKGRSSTLTISYAGVEYVKVVTADGVNSNSTLTYSNGATGNISTILVDSNYDNWTITLPSNIPHSGDLVIKNVNGVGNALGGADDFMFADIVLNSCKDTDGDGIPDYLDLDSDADGCSDAMEGGANVIEYWLVTAGGVVNGGSTTVNQNLCASSSCISTGTGNNGLPKAAFAAGYSNTTGQSVGNSQNALVNDCFCYESPTDLTAIVPVNHGISALGRAGAENGNWPMLRNSAYTALEAKTKGFVVTRTTSPETTVAIPVVGMMVFDTDEDGGKGCLKIYTGSGVGEGWKCFTTQGCPPPPSN